MVVKSSSSLKYPFYIMTILNHSTKAIQRREYAILPEAIKHVKSKLQEQDSGYMLQDDIYGWDGRIKRKDLDEQTMPTQ